MAYLMSKRKLTTVAPLDVKFLPIGGEVKVDPTPEDIDAVVLDPYSPPKVFQTGHKGYIAELRFYEPEEDRVREIELTGIVAQITLREPDLVDRRFISALYAAKVMEANGVDMHDFKEILIAAIDGHSGLIDSTWHKVQKMIDELGGME